MRKHLITSTALLLAASAIAQEPPLVDAGAPYGKLPLVQEINCAEAGPKGFKDYPRGTSRIQTILGTKCRVLLPEDGVPKYFAYVLGEQMNLKPGACYVVTVEYPEDQPRSFQIENWGCETARGLATGNTVGDAIKGRYTDNNAESLKYPISGKFRTWSQLFYLHDRFPDTKRPRGRGARTMKPEDGFQIIISQFDGKLAPMSAGAAVSRIRLFQVPNPADLNVKINFPPDDLPRRHLFWREEMADGVIAMGHKPEEKDPALRGVTDIIQWYRYKCDLMNFLGMNTFCTDLLEFGHNQGWDSTPPEGGSSDWYNQSAVPDKWQRILAMLRPYGFDVLPYFEYAGSVGQNKEMAIGSQRRCVNLQGTKDYTHISWVHYTNADLVDPDFMADAKKVLDSTIVRHKDKVNFIGAWFRPRPEANPISFNKKDLARFSREANDGKQILRSQLQTDKKLLNRYYSWWFQKRKEFLEALTDHLRQEVDKDCFILYTVDGSEPGLSLRGFELAPKSEPKPWSWKQVLTTDDPEKWRNLLDSPRLQTDRLQFLKAIDEKSVIASNAYLRALRAKHCNWGKFEWDHACPWNDPQNYRNSNKVMLSHTYNRIFTVSSEKSFDEFRTKHGLAIIRHYPLNENEMEHKGSHLLGYFVVDVERAGPYCMAAEAKAMANGDPRYIGYLTGNNFNRGFPQYVRDFNAAFLALPALPSKRLSGMTSDNDIVVREINAGKHGTYLAIVNPTFKSKSRVSIRLPKTGKVFDAATGKELQIKNGRLALAFYPCQLRSIHIR